MNKIQNEKWANALPEEAVNIAEEINIEIAKVIAERIKKIGELSPSDVKKLTNSIEFLGADYKKILELISKYSEKGKEEVNKIIKESATANDNYAKSFYETKNVFANNYHNNKYLQRLVDAMAQQTGGLFSNLSQTLAYKINDRTLSLRQMYTRAIDKAIYEVQSGTLDYHTAMRKTVKELATGLRAQNSSLVVDKKTGEVKLKWESGYSRRLDSHVRQNLIDGVKQLQSLMLDYHGDRFGSDGVELSAHAICAPDHLKVQGRQFSNTEFDKMQSGLDFEDVNGNSYNGFPRPIGQWNCRHVRFPIIIGISQPVHTEEQLQKMAENSREKYNLAQQQRALETKLRSLKTQRLAASAAGDELEAKRLQCKINEQQTIYRKFSEKHDLLYDTKRASVEGYRRISAKMPSVSEKTGGNITIITNASIKAVKNVNISGYTKDECKIIQNKHRELLMYARDNNDSKECAFIFEKDLSAYGKDMGGERDLKFTNSECVYLLRNRPSLFVMHNHPRNSSFSGRDIRFFIENENVKYLSIVKNNGNVEILTKKDSFDIMTMKNFYGRAIKKHVKIGTDLEFTKAITSFLSNSEEMIEWIK